MPYMHNFPSMRQMIRTITSKRLVVPNAVLPRSQNPPVASSIELAPLHIDSIFTNSHSEIFHGKNSPVLASTLPTTAITRSLNTEWPASALLLFTSWCSCRLTGNRKSCSCPEVAHRIVGISRIGRSYARVLIRISSNVRNELLSSKRKKSCESRVSLRWWRETSFREVVVCYSIWNLNIGLEL